MKKLVFLFFVFSTLVIACNQKNTKPTEAIVTDSLQTKQSESEKVTEIKPDKDKLKAFFKEQKKTNQVLVEPINKNETLYCYFRIKNFRATGLRLRIQCWDGSCIDADQYNIMVDGEKHTYMSNRNKEANGSEWILEKATYYWYDNAINKEDLKFLETLANAKEASVRFIDRGTNKTVLSVTLTEKDRNSIRQTIDYYFSLGGSAIPKKGMVNIRQ